MPIGQYRYKTPQNRLKITYSDIDLDFIAKSKSGDINKVEDADAVKRAMRNLLMTRKGEIGFQPEKGSLIYNSLFENYSITAAVEIEDSIRNTLVRFEPRIDVVDVTVRGYPDKNGYEASVVFTLKRTSEKETLSMFLTRVR